jgi:hypothetical protein
MAFLTLAHAQNCLVTVVLTKALFSCIAEIIQAQNGFPVQEHLLPNILRPPQWGRGMRLPWGHSSFQMELSWRSPQIVRNKTPEDHRGHSWRQWNRIIWARQNLLLQKGTQAQGHSMRKGAGSLSLLMFLTQLTLPLDLDWSRSKVHNLPNWLKFYINLGKGLRYTVWQAIFEGKGA